MSRPTVNDLAKAAGVSLATIDRVLNARAGVREQTIRRVNDAIEKIGYVRDVTAANLARQRRYRFAFVLPEGPGEFVSLLKTALAEAGTSSVIDRSDVTVVMVPPNDPHVLVKTLRRLGAADVDGVGILAPETPHVRDEIAHLKERGIAVVALVSDLPHTGRDHFVGVDNIAAGRTAAVLMGRFVGKPKGSVIVLASSMQSSSNIERRLGFDQVMAAQFPGLEILPSLEGHGDPDTVRRVMCNVLGAHPDAAGIYSVGTGNGALVDLLRQTGRGQGLVVVGHELTRNTRQALEDGTFDAVIDQNVGHIARSALRVLRAKSDGMDILPAQERIRIEIILRENLY
ncbi:MAG: LacI family DNA-binding transcriptional regulator [Rhizobiaceae bacterium]|nr:LacI family DNA-binding transcriptional regulator [Rhizobiaceae bacterium]